MDIPGAVLSTYIVLSAGNYTYRVTDLNGCLTTSAVTVITSNCKTEASGYTDLCPPAEVNLYPNPALNSIHVDAEFTCKVDGEATLEIRNVLGELIYSSVENITSGGCNSIITFNQNFSEGVYSMHLESGKEILVSEFVIVGYSK